MVRGIEDRSADQPAHEPLGEDEARFRTLADTVAAATFIFQGTALRYVNRAAAAMSGYAGDEMLAMSFWDVIHPDFRDLVRARGLARLRGEAVPASYEVKIVTKQGEERWVEYTGGTIEFGGKIAVLGTAFDITERKQAEARLRESETRFRALIEHSSDVVVLVDTDGTLRYLGPSILRVLGYDPEELRGSNTFALVHPDDREATQRSFEDLVRSGGTRAVQFRYRHKDGSWRWMEGIGSNLIGVAGVHAVIVNSRDITERKRVEEESRARAAELAHVLRVSAMGEMASALAHEINQPLGAIASYAEGCLLRLQGGEPVGDLTEALKDIAAQAVRAAEIVRGLKRFVRKEPPRRAWVDINDLVQDAIRLVDAEARHHDIAIKMDLAEDGPRAHADRIQIEQVVLNLLRNAIESVQCGAGPAREVLVRTRRVDGVARVSIADTGSGLPSDVAERLFTPFLTTKAEGLGMGLSISRTIIEAHGGRIWAEANAARGATFSFSLPAPA